MVCIIFYGGRFLYFYLDNKKTEKTEEQLFAQTIIKNNLDSKNFKQINTDYYFYNDALNNYITYSNLMFRIVKVTSNNEIVLISDNSLTSLAYGEDKEYDESYLVHWLNKKSDDTSGILEGNLNQASTYLEKTETCTDKVSDIEKISCKSVNDNYYFSILSMVDYINTGGTKSFINNGQSIYLANTNQEGKVWYINESGKLDTDDGDGIYGVKVVITLKATVSLKDGNGSQDHPYRFEEDNQNLFGSYVKLGDDVWRVYDVDNNIIKLSLNSLLEVDNEKIRHLYSNHTYYHNDTVFGSLAYYLNTTYLNSLSYKDLILNYQYSNSYYGSSTNYDYANSLNTSIDTKVANLSVGDVFVNSILDNYFLATGDEKNGKNVYVARKDGTIDTKKVQNEAYIVPCISMDKNNLTKGTGTFTDPYRTE